MAVDRGIILGQHICFCLYFFNKKTLALSCSTVSSQISPLGQTFVRCRHLNCSCT